MSIRNNMLCFGAIYLQPSFEIEETHPKDKHPHISQDQEADIGGQEFRRPKNCIYRLRETRQRSDKLLTTLITVKLRVQKQGFPSRSHHQTTFGPPESRNRRFHTKDQAYQCPSITYGTRWSASEYSWCVHHATPVQHNRPFRPLHEQAQMDPNNLGCCLGLEHLSSREH